MFESGVLEGKEKVDNFFFIVIVKELYNVYENKHKIRASYLC